MRSRTPRVRPGVGQPGSPARAPEQPLGSSPASGRRAAGDRQATNGDPAGGLAVRPTHLLAAGLGRRCGLCSAFGAPPCSAFPARGRALPRTPRTPRTHPLTPHPRREGTQRSPAQRGHPTRDMTLRCPLWLASREMRFLRAEKVFERRPCARDCVLREGKSPRPK